MPNDEIDDAIAAREDAARRLYFHLHAAAAFCIGDCYLGPSFDRHMRQAEEARSDWKTAQEAIYNWQPGTS